MGGARGPRSPSILWEGLQPRRSCMKSVGAEAPPTFHALPKVWVFSYHPLWQAPTLIRGMARQAAVMSNAREYPGYQALRRGRWSESNRIYLLTTVTKDRQRFFSDWKAASVAASVMSQADSWPGANLLCWVLMPDHWHGLVELSGNIQLAETVRVAKGRSARAGNLALERSGTVWMPGFHDRALRREESLVEAARYIVANPLRAGLVKRVGDYPFWDAIRLSR